MENESEEDKSLEMLQIKRRTKIKINRSNPLYEIEPMDTYNFDSLIAQQYIQFKIHKDPKDYKEIYNLPNGVLNSLWKFEHVKQFSSELKGYYEVLQYFCTDKTCPRMYIHQSEFLCESHGNLLRDCCALDYFKHTLDWMDVILHDNNFKSFIDFHSSFDLLEAIADRFLKIFWHSYFHHNSVFHKFESKTMLCSRFAYFGTKHSLIYEHFPKFDNNEENIFLIPIDSIPDDKNEESVSIENTGNTVCDLTCALSDYNFKNCMNGDKEKFIDPQNNENEVELSDSARTVTSYQSASDYVSFEDNGSVSSIEEDKVTHSPNTSDEDRLSGDLKVSPSMKSVYLKKGKYFPELAELSDSGNPIERSSEVNYRDLLDNFGNDE